MCVWLRRCTPAAIAPWREWPLRIRLWPPMSSTNSATLSRSNRSSPCTDSCAMCFAWNRLTSRFSIPNSRSVSLHSNDIYILEISTSSSFFVCRFFVFNCHCGLFDDDVVVRDSIDRRNCVRGKLKRCGVNSTKGRLTGATIEADLVPTHG